MNREIEKSAEYIGYAKMANLLLKFSNFLNKPAVLLRRSADKMTFLQYMMKFGERHDDIYITTFPKSGTTLMQMILYQLTTDGNTNFNHIYEVSPWIRNASLKNQEPLDLPSPRLIKTHDYYDFFPKQIKGRFIFVYRNGMDVGVSLYHQNKNYNFSNLIFEKYIKDFLKPRKRSWFNYTKEWFQNKNKFPILYLRYEDLLEKKEQEIQKIIEFLKINPSPEAIQRAIEFSSFEFMKENEDKFGVQPLPPKVYDQFIRKGKAGEGKLLFSKEQELEYLKHYNKKVKNNEILIFNKPK